MLKTTTAFVLTSICVLAVAAAASASSAVKIGIYDDSQALGNTSQAFAQLDDVRAQVVRLTLDWRRQAPTKPAAGTYNNPASYRWSEPGLYDYDAVAREAKARGINIVFSIFWTPRWAGGGTKGNLAPRNMSWLKSFARAAATRYSGKYPDPANPGATLPRVKFWTAWNEPNAPIFLKPQYKFVGGRYVIWSARQYAKMCTAVWSGVHSAESSARVSRGKVACGVTNPGGNNHPRGRRGAPSPIPFMQALRAARPRFDVYAHNPYAASRFETPSSWPSVRTRISLGNITVLLAEVKRLWGPGKRVWLTEYGYQTNPPDRFFGVTPAKQARYLKQAYARVRRLPRVDMLVWFLLKDEQDVGRWQSGLFTHAGAKKKAYYAFKSLPHR